MTPDPQFEPDPPGDGPAGNPWRALAAGGLPVPAGGAAPVRRQLRLPGWRMVAALAGVVALAGLCAASLHLVAADERAVVSVPGQPDRQLGPGLALTWPWPFAQVTTYPAGAPQVLVLNAPGDDALAPTADGLLIAPAAQVRWHVAALDAYATGLAAPEAALRELVAAELRAAIAQSAFDPLWDGSGRAAVASAVRTRVQARLDQWQAGIAIDAVTLTEANPPAALAPVYARLAQARAEAGDHSRRAAEWAARTLDNARAEARDFEQIHRQYLAAPEITRKRMYYETMERVIANNERVVVGGKGPQPAGGKAP